MDVKANIEADNHNAQQVVIMTRSRVLRPNVHFGSFADVPAMSDYRHRPDAQASAPGAGHISSYRATRPDLRKFNEIFLTQSYAARCSFYAA